MAVPVWAFAAFSAASMALTADARRSFPLRRT
jgi:hypothetical protein